MTSRRPRPRNENISKAYEKLATAAGTRDYWFLFLKIFLEKRPVEILIDELQLRLDGNVIAKEQVPQPSPASSSSLRNWKRSPAAFSRSRSTLSVPSRSATPVSQRASMILRLQPKR